MLARTLGFKHPDHMDGVLSYRQIAGWAQAYVQQPWGEYRDDVRAAQQLCATYQVHTAKKLKPDDFMVRFGEKKQLTAEEYKLKSMNLRMAQGARMRLSTNSPTPPAT